MNREAIRNFVIIAHIDHGKSTLADRFLELTGTVEKRKMHEQYLDMHPLERERGITIKMAPVRMRWHSDRGLTQTGRGQTQTTSDATLLYENLTYQIRGAIFAVRKNVGLGHKENVYQRALEIEFKNKNLPFEREKAVDIVYEGEKIGIYRPDFIVDKKVLIELKALPFIGKQEERQVWNYLKGSSYFLAFLVNFAHDDVHIRRIVYDKARLRESALIQRESAQSDSKREYVLNLIDTPGHADFGYEVSRALAAVEGAILLVDATQGVQAQTVANLHLAEREGLVVVPAINKIDLPSADVERVEKEIRTLLDDPDIEIFRVSAKEGTGVAALLEGVILRVPPPHDADLRERNADERGKIQMSAPLRALIFDSKFDAYQGVIAHVRIFGGSVKKGDAITFAASGSVCEALEVGVFTPGRTHADALTVGEIGYIATGIKETELVRVGDTIFRNIEISKYRDVEPLPGYREVAPMVFASVFPENQDEYETLRDALGKLKLEDAAMTFEPEDSAALGRGFRAGFLGMLHMEIIAERLHREYSLALLFTNPSVAFRVRNRAGAGMVVYSAAKMPLPNEITAIEEPWARLEILTPPHLMGPLTALVHAHAGIIGETVTISPERMLVVVEAPLREIIVDFHDELKSASQGFASLSYELIGWRIADVTRLDILVAGEKVPSFAEMVPREQAYHIGRQRCAKLKELLPRQMFVIAIQAEVDGRIVARESVAAMSKDVTKHMYGGDRTRKMKLWKKQQRGKERLKESGKVDIPADVFLKMLKK